MSAAIVFSGADAWRGEAAAAQAVPTLQGAWQQEGRSAMLIATASWVAIFGVDGLPSLSTYTIEGDRLTLRRLEPEKSFEDQILENDLGIKPLPATAPIVLQRFEVSSAIVSFVMPGGPTLTWRKLE